MEWIGNIVDETNNVLWTYILIVLLLGAGLYFTIGTKFVQFRMFGEMFRLIMEKKKKTRAFPRFRLLLLVQLLV